MIKIGGRKVALGMVYMLGCFSLGGKAVWDGVVGWDAAGVASLFAAIATGVGVVVWGNVQEHRAGNGK